MFTALASSTIVSGILLAFKIIFSTIFAASLFTFFGFIVPLIIPDIVKEVFYIMSVFLPFDASVVFTGINVVLSGTLAFIVAYRVFDLKRGISNG